MHLFLRLFLIIFSIIVINTLINGHIAYFYIGKEKPELDFILLKIFVTVWCVLICLAKKQHKKLKYAFCLFSPKSLKSNYSLKRILYFEKVRFKVFYCVLWVMMFFSFLLIILNFFNLNQIELITRNYLYYQLIMWFLESFLLVMNNVKKRKTS